MSRPPNAAAPTPAVPGPVSTPPPPTAVPRVLAVLALVTLAALIPLFGPAAALDGTGEAAVPATRTLSLLRALLFGALCLQIGEVFAESLARRIPGARALPGVRSWTPYAAAAGVLAALGLAAIVSTGNLLPHHLHDIDFGALSRSREGMLALAEVNAFVFAWLLGGARSPLVRLLPPAAVVLAEALRAHPPTEESALFGSALTVVHLSCAAAWAGGLLYVLRRQRAWRATHPGEAVALLGRYARAAGLLLAALTATGVCSTLRRMPPETVLDQLFTTGYGRTLCAKVLLVAVVALLALAARLRLSRAADPLSAGVPARAEVVLLAAVVVASALLTAMPLPIRW
ncbi:CopD family protein [Streptomyces physcomitrii]|uniref:CopD family protein n=1 Tax=Streptomyces physcomitrii TaxID=2724184 RepID=UPI003F4CC2FB